MKDLLTAIKSRLQADLTYIRNSDIYVTEDERMLRDAMKSPAIGIKDGAVEYEVLGRDEDQQSKLYVKIIAYVDLQKPGAAIMGDTSAGKKGVLDIIIDCITSLKFNKLGGIVNRAVPVAESESEFIGDEEAKIAIQMKSVTMLYERY